MTLRKVTAIIGLLTSFGSRVFAGAPAPDPRALQFFESKVRPVLATHCYVCHSEGVKFKSGLKLDSREAMVQGGTRGPAIVAGAPEQSRLIEAVRYQGALKMPPKGKLRDTEIAALIEWVKQGAPWPTATVSEAARAAARTGNFIITEEQRKFWSFQPMKTVALPKVKNSRWVQSPIDQFVLAKLEAKGLRPAPAADRRTLIRRATFDLTGLPPSPEEVEAFLNDRSASAFAKVVNRLLESPRYGERWGRHWLDVVRYADSNGQDENTAHANAFRYRDYVIAALNDDLPYNEFIREQLAGDLLPPDPDPQVNYRRLIATGFLVLGPKVLAEPDKAKMAIDIIDEQMDVTSRAFLGVTFTCARCHDHKFDPFSQRDYYALAGIFRSTKTMATYATVARWFERPLAPQEEADRAAAHQAQIARTKDALQKIRNENGKEMERRKLMQELAELERTQPKSVDYCMAVTEDKVVDLPLHIRGDHNKLGDLVPRGLPVLLAGANQDSLPVAASGRLELANWIARSDHPLSARVPVNRLWQGHFGKGLVATSDNFGKLGDRPSHPELLDWLALRLIAHRWSQKQLHREIMLSATYQQRVVVAEERAPSRASLVDPDNRLLWRQNRQRLNAEALRDALLFLSGQLEVTMGGSSLQTANYGYVTNDQSANQGRYDVKRRSIYLPVVRNALFDLFQVFDFVDPSVVNATRAETTVAPQALYLMNNPLVREAAQHFASRLLALPAQEEADRVRAAFERVFQRPASASEVTRATRFLTEYTSAATGEKTPAEAARRAAWDTYCQTLFCANEFLYVD